MMLQLALIPAVETLELWWHSAFPPQVRLERMLPYVAIPAFETGESLFRHPILQHSELLENEEIVRPYT